MRVAPTADLEAAGIVALNQHVRRAIHRDACGAAGGAGGAGRCPERPKPPLTCTPAVFAWLPEEKNSWTAARAPLVFITEAGGPGKGNWPDWPSADIRLFAITACVTPTALIA